MTAFIAIDLGGSNTRLGLVAGDGLLAHRLLETRTEQGPALWLERVAAACGELRAEAAVRGLEVAGVGLASPGVLDHQQGVVLSSPNLRAWEGFPLRRELEAACGLPCVMDNDANLYALGEYRFGAGRGERDMALFTLGTGVGGGVILGGRLLRGGLGLGGELGHINVEPGGRVCGCGARGCLEAYASATALRGMLCEEINAGAHTRLGFDDGVKSMDRAARDGDPLALELFQRAGWALGRAVNNLVAVTGVELVVIGGGVARGWDLMAETCRRELAACLRMVPAEKVRLVSSALQEDAPLLGAAELARRRFGKEPLTTPPHGGGEDLE